MQRYEEKTRYVEKIGEKPEKLKIICKFLGISVRIICKSSVISARIVQLFHSKTPTPPGSFTFLPLKVLVTLLPLKVLFISYWYASSLFFLHIDERYPFSQLYSLMSEP